MAIPAPAIRWPAEFSEQGPAEDSAIMLMGRAEIAGVGFNVMAMRMRAGMRVPDFRDDVPQAAYSDALDSMIGDISDVEGLVGSMEPELISMNDVQYMLWMVPSARE